MATHDQAIKIATESLRACYEKNGIIAGPHHFTDYWARDGYFAALGSLSIGDNEIVSKMLDLFFSHQRGDGLIPYRIMRGPLSLAKYFGRPSFYKSPKPTYRLRGIGQPVLDGTTLTVLFAALLGRKSKLTQIKSALEYLKTKERHGLLWDGPMGEWNDAVWKWGNLLYSNIIYWYMYDRLANWTKTIDPTLSTALSTKSTQIAHDLRSRLWTGGYFADWHDYKRQDYFYPFGNCLAIAWGFTTEAESSAILKKCQTVRSNFSLETNTPKYPWWRVDLFQRLAGMSDYQNHGILWWQPVTTYLKALRLTNHKDEVKTIEDQIIKRIITDQTVSECYERSGQPVKRAIYTSEHPFAWASGLILWSMTGKNIND